MLGQFEIDDERQQLFDKLDGELKGNAEFYFLDERFPEEEFPEIICIDVSQVEGCHYGHNNVFVPLIERLEKQGISIDGEVHQVTPDKAILIEPSTGNGFIAFTKAAHLLGYETKVIMPDGMPEARYRGGENYAAEIIRTPAEKYARGMPERIEELIAQNRQRLKSGEKIFASPNHCIGESGDITVARMGLMVKQLDRWMGANYSGVIGSLSVSVGNGSSLCGLGEAIKRLNPQTQVHATESFACGLYYNEFARNNGLDSYLKLYGIEPAADILMKHFTEYGTNAPIGIKFPLQKRGLNIVDNVILCANHELLDAFNNGFNPSMKHFNQASRLPRWDKLPQRLHDHYGNSSLMNIAAAISVAEEDAAGIAMIYDGRDKYTN